MMIAPPSRLTLFRTFGMVAALLVLVLVLAIASIEPGKPAPSPAIAVAAAAPVATPAPPPAPASRSMPSAMPAPKPAPPTVSARQAAVAHWIGSKYHVAPEAIAPLVVEADKLSALYHLSPQLLIAVMAIESNFHPYIQSEAGAQGLMQVMPSVHAKRYEKFGGKGSFVDPIVSLKVGAEILRDCVKLRGGSETEALRFYFGGGAASDAYIDKVRAEQRRLVLAAAGAHPPVD